MTEEIRLEDLNKESFVKNGKPILNGDGRLLSKVDVNVTVVLGTASLTLKDLMNLSSGDVIKLEQSVGDPVAIEYDGITIASGVLVATDGNLGVLLVGD